jgi:hypothetical protein
MADGSSFIIAAYVVTWIAFVGYSIHLRSARKNASRRYDDASRDVAGERR